MTSASPPRRGRPPATSSAEIARVALALFLRDGYDSTTLEHVAAAAGITRRSLFRYFESKAAIVWFGEEEAQQAAVEALRAAGADVPWRTGVARAVLAALRFPDDDLEALRLRLRLIASVPALQQHRAAASGVADAETVAYIAAATGAAPGDVAPRAVARAVWAASGTALTWWAEQTGAAAGPRAAVEDALAALGLRA